MNLVSLNDIRAAAAAISPVVIETPLLPAEWAPGLWLKPENLQPVGAFKLRGAAHAVSRLPGTVNGVATHSSGNHGRALGYAARAAGIDCVVVVPDTAPRVKRDAMRATGAELVEVAASHREWAAERLCAERGLTLVPPFDHDDVIAGQGTIGLEILSALPDVDTVVVPVGGGGLISGVSTAIKAARPDTRIVGAEPELAADAADSLHAGRLMEWPLEDRYRTIADGVRVGLSPRTFAHITAHVDDIVTVSESDILSSMATLAERSHLVAEPSGALATAAYLRHGENWGSTAAVISGGNVDPRLLAETLSHPDQQ